MAASGFCLEAVRDFIIQNGFKVSNHELVTKFKSYLNDPYNKGQSREKFKDFVNTLATIKQDEKGDKVLVLKKKFRPDEAESDSRQDRAMSEPPAVKGDVTDGGGMSKVRSENNIMGDSASDSSSMRESASNLSLGSINSSTMSTASQNSLQSGAEEEVNMSVLSVKERAQHLNKMESQSALDKVVPSPKRKEARPTTAKEGSDHGEDDSHSSGSGYVALDAEEREWIVTCSSGEYHAIFKMLQTNPRLASVRDFMSGYTALHWAAKHGKPEVIKLIASKHVDVNKRSNGGYTPLHLAAIHGHEDIIELLVQTYKADANLRDYSGKKAKQYLRNTASTKAQQLLLSRKLGSSVVSGRSLDDSFTRSASFRRSKQIKAIGSLIHGTSSGVKAMFRSTWAGSAEELNRLGSRNSRSRSPSSTPPGSTGQSPNVRRRQTVSGKTGSDRDKELMPPPSAPVRRGKQTNITSGSQNGSHEEMQRTTSEPSLPGIKTPSKTYI